VIIHSYNLIYKDVYGKIIHKNSQYNRSKILWTNSLETRNKISETLKNKEKIKCPYCDKIGAQSGMKRYHFNNCKFNKRLRYF